MKTYALYLSTSGAAAGGGGGGGAAEREGGGGATRPVPFDDAGATGARGIPAGAEGVDPNPPFGKVCGLGLAAPPRCLIYESARELSYKHPKERGSHWESIEQQQLS